MCKPICRRRISAPCTPRKKILKRLISRQRVTISRLRKKLRKPVTTNHRRQSSTASAVPPGTLGKFLASQARLSRRKKLGRRYTVSDKRFALSLFYASPKAYRLCSKMFYLPSVSMLRVWMRRISVGVGFTSNVFDMLCRKAETMCAMSRICCLVLDEISLKSGFKYCRQNDRIIGYEDFGEGCDCDKPANHALVLMARGLFDRWKQPLAYFFVSNTSPATKLHRIVTECTRKLRSAGFTVACIICDQGATNRQMFDMFGVTVDVPYVDVDGDIVHFMYDPPHLVKCLRNNFMKYDLLFNGHRVKWQYLLDFYARDSKQKLKLAPKLTEKHFNLPPFASMRVRLATQIFSHSLAAGIFTHVSLGAMVLDAEYTAEFIEMVDGLFDCFNAGNLNNAKELRRALKPSSPHWEHLKKCKSVFQSMEVIGCKSKVPCISGFVLSITCLQHLFHSLVDKFDISFLLTNRLNQDCLENHFATIRGRGGFRDSPTPDAFAATFRQVLVQHLLSPPKGANCADDMTDFLLKLQDVERHQTTQKVDAAIPTSVALPHSSLPLAMSADCDLPELEENSLNYVAGYACKTILKEHECQFCTDMLLVQCKDKNELPTFFQFKLYGHCSASSLFTPSQFSVTLLQKCQTVFTDTFEQFRHKPGILARLFAASIAEVPKMPEVAECRLSDCTVETVEKVIGLFLRILLYHNVKLLNRPLISQTGKKNRKAQKVMHN